jgi:phage-related minor tail protein
MMVIEAKAGMMSMIKGIGGLFSGGGGGGGMMGMIGSIGSMFGFADGGTPPTNVPSIVGERGPELFVPKTSGTVIPNNQLASALGGGGQTVNYNGPFIASMSAIDTQSGVQFLAKNKQTIWASYQSANRSVPVSR